MASTTTRLASGLPRLRRSSDRLPIHRLPLLRLPDAVLGVDARAVVSRWVITRSLTLMLLVTIERNTVNDVTYYARILHALFSGGQLTSTLIEYPTPVLLLLLPPFLVAGLNEVAFGLLFALAMLVADALFTAVLYRADGRRRGDATTLWLWFVPCFGPTLYFRFDVIPAALVAVAVLTANRRGALCGAITALGAALKLWPALMLPAFLLQRGQRRSVLVSFGITGGAFAVSSLWVGGLARTLSPLRWQSERGLQIESVPAAVLMLVRSLHVSHAWFTPLTRYKAVEIVGPGVFVFVALSTAATAAGLIVLAVLWNRVRRASIESIEIVGWLVLAAAAVVTITNKVFSPQYVIWLVGPVAALSAWRPGNPHVRRVAHLLLLITVLTQLDYPIMYSWLTDRGWVNLPATVVLEIRNALLVWLTWIACRRVWEDTRRHAVTPTP